MNNKIIIITGLTASGKSNLAMKIAKEFNGEIISADSVQIYKNLNIGSAKEPVSNREEIPHHLIDIKEPNENYNVGEFINDCNKSINSIISKNKLPIIIGGTGMYVKALVDGYSLGGTSANQDFRTNYENIAKEHGNQRVWQDLNELNPQKAKTVHYNNLKRVIRYLEIEKFGNNTTSMPSILANYDVCLVGIIDDREHIYNKINLRVDQMIDQGLENEVTKLYHSGITRDMQSVNSIGYKEWFDYFEGKQDKVTTINLIKQHTRNYAKRQLTFLKTIKSIKLLNYTEAEKTIRSFLND